MRIINAYTRLKKMCASIKAFKMRLFINGIQPLCTDAYQVTWLISFYKYRAEHQFLAVVSQLWPCLSSLKTNDCIKAICTSQKSDSRPQFLLLYFQVCALPVVWNSILASPRWPNWLAKTSPFSFPAFPFPIPVLSVIQGSKLKNLAGKSDKILPSEMDGSRSVVSNTPGM